MKKFIITEEEKSRIIGLYEQWDDGSLFHAQKTVDAGFDLIDFRKKISDIFQKKYFKITKDNKTNTVSGSFSIENTKQKSSGVWTFTLQNNILKINGKKTVEKLFQDNWVSSPYEVYVNYTFDLTKTPISATVSVQTVDYTTPMKVKNGNKIDVEYTKSLQDNDYATTTMSLEETEKMFNDFDSFNVADKWRNFIIPSKFGSKIKLPKSKTVRIKDIPDKRS